MDTSEMKKRQMLESAEEKLVMLENAKRYLYQNSSELKSQIHSQMSRFLEALRNREVQLLNQVDQIQSQREEALHKQHAVLSRSLGQLQRTVVSTVEEEKDLHGRFAKLSLSELVPEELPYMTFKATPVGLNDVLMNFGRITANGIPLADNRSASLPKQFEDYGDAEHHVLYKTVEKIQQGPNSKKKIFVNIPRLTSTSEWLAKPPSVTKTVAPSSPVAKCMFAPFKDSKTSSWLAKSSLPAAPVTHVPQTYKMCLPQMTKNTSIQHWLHQIKQNPDNEDDGFELLDGGELSSDGDTDSIEIVSSSPPSAVYGPLHKNAGDKRCHDTENSLWLSSPKRKVMAMEKPANLPTFSYFKKLAAQDLSIWLAKKKSNSSVSRSNCCSTNDVIKYCDIENLGDSACIEKLTKNFKAQILREPCQDPDKNGGSPLPPVSSLCKANEVCEKYSECLSKPSCIEEKWLYKIPEFSPEKNSVNKANPPLSQAKSPSDVNNKGMMFGPFSNKFEMSVWLKKNKEDKENVPAESFSLKASNIGSSSKSLNDWLIKPNDKNQATTYTKFSIKNGNDIYSWLDKPTSKEIYKVN